MKRVKALLIAVCLVVTMAGLLPIALASSYGIGAGNYTYMKCPVCSENSVKATFLSYRQATQGLSGFVDISLVCGHTFSRATKYWGSDFNTPGNILGLFDIILIPECYLTGNPELVVVTEIIYQPNCDSLTLLSVSHQPGGCTAGGGVQFRSLGHQYIESNRIPATCLPGTIEYTCSACNQTKTESLPADPTAHTWTETSRTPATCLPGSIEYTCSTCQQTKTEPIPALENAHTYEISEIVPAEYDSDGNLVANSYIIYSCSACGNSYNSSIGGGISGPIIDEGAGGNGMQDSTAAVGKTFLSGVWALFGIYVPGFSFTFGQMWLGFLLCSISILVVRMIFGFGGSRGDSPRTSSTNNPRISEERRHDEF